MTTTFNTMLPSALRRPVVRRSIIGALVGFLRRTRAAGGDVKLAGLTPDIETIFEVTRLHRVFSIHPTVSAALDDFGTDIS